MTEFTNDGGTARGATARLTIGAALAATLMAALFPVTARAETLRNCAPRDVVVERLAGGYGESRQSIGLGPQGAVMEVFASSATGTWTITVTSPSGVTCLIASGQSFEALHEVLPAEDSDA